MKKPGSRALLDAAASRVETGGSSGPGVGLVAASAAAVVGALGGAGWYARRRLGGSAS